MIADSRSNYIKYMENYFNQLLNVQAEQDIEEDLQTAEILVTEPSAHNGRFYITNRANFPPPQSIVRSQNISKRYRHKQGTRKCP